MSKGAEFLQANSFRARENFKFLPAYLETLRASCGAEAAATGVAMGRKSMAFDVVTFRANRPFLFFIEDSKTGLILFMGRMEKPESNR